jgi:hypothetical protein
MTRSRRAAIAAFLIVAASAAILLAMGRHPICTCGIVHGLLFYAALWLIARRAPVEWRFLAALAIETAWEMTENTSFVIDRYRTATVALGYNGDSVINSISDISMMCLGFLLARKLPVWVSVVLLVVLELVPLFVIRDNLTLNVWMLLAPNDAIAAWQARG